MEKDEEYDSKEIIEFLDELKENEVKEENWLSFLFWFFKYNKTKNNY